MTTKLFLMCVTAASAAYSGVAMPTEAEVEKAVSKVERMLASEKVALESGKMTRAEVAEAATKLAAGVDDEAAKLLLMKGAFILHVKDGNLEKAVKTMNALETAIADMPPQVITNIIETALLGVSEQDVKRVGFYKLLGEGKNGVAGGVQLWENGPYWAECNIGATKPEEYGYYFWWGDTVGYKPEGGVPEEGKSKGWFTDVTWVSSKGARMGRSPFDKSDESLRETCHVNKANLRSRGYVDREGNLVSQRDAATAHLGEPWRMPTSEELDALTENCTTRWIERNGVSGRLVTGKGNFSTKSIFLPAAGYGFDSRLANVGSLGDYRSSTPGSYSIFFSWFLDFGQYNPRVIDFCYPSETGMTIRPVRNANFPNLKSQDSSVAPMKWTYKVVDGGIVLGGRVKTAVPETTTGVLEIPETIDGMPVRSIGERAFYQCRGLTSVTIPSSVTNIEDWAFWGCTGLRSVTIPSGVKNIGDQVFYWCTSLRMVTIPDGVTSVGVWAFYANWKLTSVTIPASVVHIGKSAFCYCKGLRTIHVVEGNSVYSSIDGILYNKTQTELIQCPAGRVESVTIPSSVTNIGTRAFDSCNGLTSVTIPVNVTHIGDLAFSNCSGMSDFIVAEGNTEYCSRDGILYNKAMNKVIQCPCKKAGAVSIPSGVTTIGWCAFSNCRGLTSVEIPLSVTNLEQGAFSGCSGLTSVTIPSSVTSIGPMAFQFCGNIQSMTIPSSVADIGQWAFRCKGLMSVTMLGERPIARTGVFLDCKKLTAIHVPANAKSWAGMKEWQGIPLVFDGK